VNGIRVDYLSPTIFLTDLCVTGLFVLSARAFFKAISLWHVVGVGILAIGIFLSPSPFAGWYGLLKLVEFGFLGWFVATNTKKVIQGLEIALPVGILIESVLGIWQFILQHSVGGLWYFLGERTFSGDTPGIANVSLNNVLVLRPYGTFPHPNVLAGFLLISLLFLFVFLDQQTRVRKMLYMLCLGIGSIMLFLTLSRTAIFVACVFVLGSFARKFLKKKKQMLQVMFAIFFFLFIFFLLSPRLTGINITGESVVLREKLLSASWQMITGHPLLGVGLNNFLVVLPSISSLLSLQPVHNIYVLVLSETGVVGFVLFTLILWNTIRHVRYPFEHRLRENTRIFVLCSIFVFLFVGLLDHYFLTLQQGQLLTTLIFGLAWTRDGK